MRLICCLALVTVTRVTLVGFSLKQFEFIWTGATFLESNWCVVDVLPAKLLMWLRSSDRFAWNLLVRPELLAVCLSFRLAESLVLLLVTMLCETMKQGRCLVSKVCACRVRGD